GSSAYVSTVCFGTLLESKHRARCDFCKYRSGWCLARCRLPPNAQSVVPAGLSLGLDLGTRFDFWSARQWSYIALSPIDVRKRLRPEMVNRAKLPNRTWRCRNGGNCRVDIVPMANENH